MSEPVGVQANVGYSDEAAGRPVEHPSGGESFDRCPGAAGVQVRIEGLFPHGREKHHLPSLSEILLGDLKLDGLVGFFERPEEGRCRFAYLEIDGAVLDLDNGIVVKRAVELDE